MKNAMKNGISCDVSTKLKNLKATHNDLPNPAFEGLAVMYLQS